MNLKTSHQFDSFRLATREVTGSGSVVFDLIDADQQYLDASFQGVSAMDTC